MTIITLEYIDGAVEASGIVPGVTESTGVCTLTISRNGVTQTATADANPGRDVTYCGLVSIPGSDLEPGTWSAVLDYRSSTSAAQSAPMDVEVSP